MGNMKRNATLRYPPKLFTANLSTDWKYAFRSSICSATNTVILFGLDDHFSLNRLSVFSMRNNKIFSSRKLARNSVGFRFYRIRTQMLWSVAKEKRKQTKDTKIKLKNLVVIDSISSTLIRFYWMICKMWSNWSKTQLQYWNTKSFETPRKDIHS